jgi:hypothetical protein
MINIIKNTIKAAIAITAATTLLTPTANAQGSLFGAFKSKDKAVDTSIVNYKDTAYISIKTAIETGSANVDTTALQALSTQTDRQSPYIEGITYELVTNKVNVMYLGEVNLDIIRFILVIPLAKDDDVRSKETKQYIKKISYLFYDEAPDDTEDLLELPQYKQADVGMNKLEMDEDATIYDADNNAVKITYKIIENCLGSRGWYVNKITNNELELHIKGKYLPYVYVVKSTTARTKKITLDL